MTIAATSGSFWLLLPVQGTACITVGLAASYLLRDRPARAHQALLTALLASVLMPGAYVLVKHLGLGALAARPALQTQARAMNNLSLVRPLTDSAEPQAPQGQQTRPSYASVQTETPGDPMSLSTVDPTMTAAAHDAAITRVPWGMVAAVCWIATSTLLLMRLTLRFLLGLQLLKTARPLESERLHRAAEAASARLGIPGPVRIRGSEPISSPVIWCWASEPVLLVHEKAGQQEDNVDWVGIFCHEFAHLRRHDHMSGLLAEVLTALFPWHPLLWWVRGRLVRLSEQACDDWVLAAGQIGVDYAESLLDLSPQRQVAILPTVAGKEKAMKERIRRIVKDGCGNPTVGLRWAAAVTVLAVLFAVGVAFAQRRPAEREPGERESRPELREESAGQRPAVVGRRNVLMRLREQLQNQARETENALRERGDEMGEDGRVLHAELETLHQQIELVERQLRDLEGGPRRPGQVEAPSPELEARLNELRRHREELAENAGGVERELGGLRDGQDQEARELKARLEDLHAQMGEVDRQLAELQPRAQAEVGTGRARPPQPQAPPENVRQRRAELAEETRHIEQRIRELRPDQDQEARELKARLEQLHAGMAELDNRSAELRRVQGQVERTRADAEPRSRTTRTGNPRLEAEVDELRNQVNGLREQMQQLQRTLEQLVQQKAGEQPQRR